MSRVRIHTFSVSADGYAAGPDQSLDAPVGAGGLALHDWVRPTHTFQQTHGDGTGTTGTDDDFVRRGFENIGAWIIGRHMFGPVRGPWTDDRWRGWWGDNPPYHTPVFVLTHHARPPIEMAGGTVFHFVTDGATAALDRARTAAGDRDVRIGGGVATVREYVAARLVDEMHLAVVPVLLGRGESLYAGLDLAALGYRCVERVTTPNAMHLVVRRTP